MRGALEQSLALQEFAVDGFGDLAEARERVPLGVLAVDELAVDLDVEHAAPPGFEGAGGVVSVLGLEFGDETRRLWQVVSSAAVGDVDLHGSSLLRA